MDLISSNSTFRRRLILIWSAMLGVLHILFTLLSMYDSYISGDLAHKTEEAVLAIILPVIALLIVYIRSGVLVSAYHSYRTGTLAFTLVAVASIVLSRISEHIIYRFTYSKIRGSIWSYLLSILTSFMIELAIVLILLVLSRSKKESSRKAVRLMLIACALPFVVSLFDEISFLILFWIQDMAGQIVFSPVMAYPFIHIAVNAIIGFLIMLITHTILKKPSQKK